MANILKMKLGKQAHSQKPTNKEINKPKHQKALYCNTLNQGRERYLQRKL